MPEERTTLPIHVFGTSGQVCFEPCGMCYDLADGEKVTVSLDQAQLHGLEVTYWPGGVSVVVTGEFTVYDKNGAKLDELWGG